jgi:hypothetical protein
VECGGDSLEALFPFEMRDARYATLNAREHRCTMTRAKSEIGATPLLDVVSLAFAVRSG